MVSQRSQCSEARPSAPASELALSSEASLARKLTSAFGDRLYLDGGGSSPLTSALLRPSDEHSYNRSGLLDPRG